MPVYRSLITAIAPEHHRGGLVSLLESIARLASTVIPIVMGAAIATATPALGFALALRVTSFAVAAIASTVAVICVVIAARTTENRETPGSPSTAASDRS
jgi:MFS family permease